MKCDVALVECVLLMAAIIVITIALFYEFHTIREDIKKIDGKVRDINDDLNDLEGLYNDSIREKTDN